MDLVKKINRGKTGSVAAASIAALISAGCSTGPDVHCAPEARVVQEGDTGFWEYSGGNNRCAWATERFNPGVDSRRLQEGDTVLVFKSVPEGQGIPFRELQHLTPDKLRQYGDAASIFQELYGGER